MEPQISMGEKHGLKKPESNLDKRRQNLWKPLCGHVYQLDGSYVVFSDA